MAAVNPQQRIAISPLPLSDRLAVWGGLALITVLAWVYLLRMPMSAGGDMSGMPGMKMAISQPHPWMLADVATAFAMWTVMMVAMMVPTASPMVTIYARTVRARGAHAGLKIAMFVSGYIVAWTIFSAAATLIQLALQKTALISANLAVAPVVGGAILIAAGFYQVTPFKQVCLRHCRSPLGFFMTQWREGASGALTMGLKHGAFCVGCCWMLMGLLFAAGVMNLLWVALIAIFVLFEKVLPWERLVAYAAGLALIGAGLWMIVVR
jgi:predicted metal-binding membrane protein